MFVPWYFQYVLVCIVLYVLEGKPKELASRLPAAPAYGLIRRGCSPANLVNARHAMAARRAWPAADGGRLAQQTRLAGQAIKPGAL